MTDTTRNFFRLFFLLLLTNAVGYLSGTLMTDQTMAWYDTLAQSSLTPSPVVFMVVWPILYILMSISAFLVWGKASPRYFCLQLVANGLWTVAFFYFRSPLTALIILLLMILFVVLTMRDFYKASKPAAWLLIPLLVWGFFALYLNTFVVLMN